MRNRNRLAAFALVALPMLLAGCSDNDWSDFAAFAFEGDWVNGEDPSHTLRISQGDYAGAVSGRLDGIEAFGRDGPISPFAGTFLDREMIVTVERPDGPLELEGDLLENDLLLVTSPFGDAYLFVRR